MVDYQKRRSALLLTKSGRSQSHWVLGLDLRGMYCEETRENETLLLYTIVLKECQDLMRS
jgi:hypothetical protein